MIDLEWFVVVSPGRVGCGSSITDGRGTPNQSQNCGMQKSLISCVQSGNVHSNAPCYRTTTISCLSAILSLRFYSPGICILWSPRSHEQILLHNILAKFTQSRDNLRSCSPSFRLRAPMACPLVFPFVLTSDFGPQDRQPSTPLHALSLTIGLFLLPSVT